MFIQRWYAYDSIDIDDCSFPLFCGRVRGFMIRLPDDQHITYQFQHRKCGKSSCSTCRDGQGHGPYWYAYWREGSRLRSGYIGKVPPSPVTPSALQASIEANIIRDAEETTAVMV